MDDLQAPVRQGRYIELPTPMTTREGAAAARRALLTITRMWQIGAIKAVGHGGKWSINRDSLLRFAGLI